MKQFWNQIIIQLMNEVIIESNPETNLGFNHEESFE